MGNAKTRLDRSQPRDSHGQLRTAEDAASFREFVGNGPEKPQRQTFGAGEWTEKISRIQNPGLLRRQVTGGASRARAPAAALSSTRESFNALMHVISRRRVAKQSMLKTSLMGNTIKSMLLDSRVEDKAAAG